MDTSRIGYSAVTPARRGGRSKKTRAADLFDKSASRRKQWMNNAAEQHHIVQGLGEGEKRHIFPLAMIKRMMMQTIEKHSEKGVSQVSDRAAAQVSLVVFNTVDRLMHNAGMIADAAKRVTIKQGDVEFATLMESGVARNNAAASNDADVPVKRRRNAKRGGVRRGGKKPRPIPK